MKKSVAIILSAILLLTSVFTASVFSVVAENGETGILEDTVIMPKYVDSVCDEVAPHPTVKGMQQIEKTLRIALSE